MSPLRREYECVAESADGIGRNHGVAFPPERTFPGRPRRDAAAIGANAALLSDFLRRCAI